MQNCKHKSVQNVCCDPSKEWVSPNINTVNVLCVYEYTCMYVYSISSAY